MKELIHLQKIIYPDLLETMQKRYTVLYTIHLFQPIGRRGIVDHTSMPERYIRNEISLLQEQGLIDMTTKGMLITNEGKNIIDRLHSFIREVSGLISLENKLKSKTAIENVIIVAGDSDVEPYVKQALGRATVQFLKTVIKDNVTIAVTGGTTMAAVANAMVPLEGFECLFVPARGGVGEKVENQANTIVAQMAKAEKGDYRLLHVPDPLSEDLYQSMIKEQSIMETLNLIKHANIVIHGIGDALTMAKRRKTSANTVQQLINEQAVSEAFGYYFDKEGNIVHKVRTIGIHLEDLKKINKVITVAGGKSKAQAIASYMKQGKSDVLITDEAAANEIVKKYLL
ncbi:sugar-binding transcriptional regulator [Pseudogracilibacillus sp. SO30301A]|uniref:sugar-binding transcriptional regulator n=1 Tax=Pseudogracilibacillus sp. SO30301A TaxID=3098291 RepID=UPI00300DC179